MTRVTDFFETLVRVHRAGEGAPYTGLNPAGRDLGPAIPAADQAIADGSADHLIELLTHAVRHSVEERFKLASAGKSFPKDNLQAGREYVKAYVEFLHQVEKIYEAATSSAHE